MIRGLHEIAVSWAPATGSGSIWGVTATWRTCVGPMIGAAKAAAYFAEYRAVFPRGAIPVDRRKRYRILEKEEARLQRIDTAHKTAIRDMLRRTQAYVRANPQLLKEALGLSRSRRPAARGGAP